MPVKTETILWLLPVIFMVHDFEEVVMMTPWMRRNAQMVQERFPPAGRFLPHFMRLSASSMAFMVGILFVTISALTLIAVEFGLYNLWAGLMIVFCVHLIVHVAQCIILGAYAPVLVTSIPAIAYCIWAAWTLHARVLIEWGQAGLWAGGLLIALIPVFICLQRLGGLFETWLQKTYPA